MNSLIKKAHAERGDAEVLPSLKDFSDDEQRYETCFIGKGQFLIRENIPDQYRNLSNRENNFL